MINSKMYKKRTGTSGIQGHLYETKLISLIYFRMIHDDSFEKFSLSTNRDDVGAFDDICFKVNVKGFDKPLVVFLQAKHRENDKLLTFTSKTDLIKYFGSYLVIRRAFESSSKDVIFSEKFDDIECVFVMYTTAKDDPNNKTYESAFAEYLNKLIGTGGDSTQTSYTDNDLGLLCKILMEDQIITLAKQLAEFICDKSDSVMLMNDDIMMRYHVILALKVFEVSEIQPKGHRIASFRADFFAINEEFLVLFKNILCLEVLKKQKSVETDIQNLLLKFLEKPSDAKTLSKLLVESDFKYKNEKLEFISKSITDDQKRLLDKANVPPSTVYEAAELAAKEYLLSLKLKVPAFFGNKDLAIRGNDKNIQRRLKHLTAKLQKILKQSNLNHIVTIDESLEEGFLQLNGGIASAVGNIIVFDETSKLLKFTDNSGSLGNLAKAWYETLTTEIPNLHEYRLDVKGKEFPKLTFEREKRDEDLVRDFYNKLVFYTNQADQNRVEEMLRKEIENHPRDDVNSFTDRSGLIFLEYHDKIQKLWMTPKEAPYLTDKNKIYENAVTYAMSQSLIGVLKIIQNIKYQDLIFNNDAIERFELHGQILDTVIASESCTLTLAKVEQYLRNQDYVALHLEHIFKLPLKTQNNLCKELTSTTKNKIFIIVCNTIQDSSNSNDRLKAIAKAIDGKQVIIITNKTSVEIMTKNFPQASNVWDDERSVFTDLSVDSQKKFLATSKIKLQGVDVSLDTIVDDESVGLIDQDIFYKILNSETVKVGNTPIYSIDDKLFYIERRVSRTKQREDDKFDEVKNKDLRTLYDLKDNVVLITAMPGMGKSTLLTHLSLKTKELDPEVWIVRINLLDHSKTLSNWQDSKLVINTIESLKFICQVALDEKYGEINKEDDIYIELEESPNRIVTLNKCSGGNTTVFQLKIFLHFYNRRKLIFIFDGFDEIFPDYEREALSLLKCVRSYPRQHQVWITSRSFNRIKSVLEQEFGRSYEIEHFSRFEQATYFNTFWKLKIQLQNLNKAQLQNVRDFAKYMVKLIPSKNFLVDNFLQRNPYHVVYLNFLSFLNTESVATGIHFSYDKYTSYLSEFDQYRLLIGFPHDLIAPPLHLYLLAECFHKKIKDVNEKMNSWDIDMTGYIFYEYYYETKIKKIRFQEKNKVDIFNPDNKRTYEKEHADSVAKHKKLGAYAIFYPYVEVFEEAVLKEIKEIIDDLNDGRENTGLIRTVADNLPLFVHMSFAEYFAIEYICDQLKIENSEEKQEKLWNFIVNVMFRECGRSNFYLFVTKIKMDEELRNVVENNKRVIFRLLYEQNKCYLTLLGTNYEITENRNRGMDYEEMYRNGLLVISMCKDLSLRNVLDVNSSVDFNDLIHFNFYTLDKPLDRTNKYITVDLLDVNGTHFVARDILVEISPRFCQECTDFKLSSLPRVLFTTVRILCDLKYKFMKTLYVNMKERVHIKLKQIQGYIYSNETRTRRVEDTKSGASTTDC